MSLFNLNNPIVINNVALSHTETKNELGFYTKNEVPKDKNIGSDSCRPDKNKHQCKPEGFPNFEAETLYRYWSVYTRCTELSGRNDSGRSAIIPSC